jgi:outer membrane protein TolC
VIGALLVPQLAAQEPSQGGTTQPPAVRFSGEGISLEEAIRRTLDHDPDIQRAQASVTFARGVTQERRGAFDPTLFGSAAYSRRVQELSDAAKADQQKRRDELDSLIQAGPDRLALAGQARDLLGRVRGGTASSEELTATSPRLAATLVTLDELIETSSPSQAALLRGTRDQVLDDAITIADAELETEQTVLERAQTQRRDIGDAPVDEQFTDATVSLQLATRFRSGFQLTPFVDAAFNSTGFVGKPHEAAFGGKGLTDLYELRAGASGLFPLLRGRGAEAVAAPERAAAVEEDASRLSLEHQRAQSVLRTVLAYWNLRAAQEAVGIATSALQFQSEVTTLISQLVASGDLAGVEQSRAQAAEARARADFEDAQQRFTEARVDLAVAMGVAATEDDATLPRAAQTFPVASAAPPAAAAGLVTQALGDRRDLQAAARFEEAGDLLLRGAQRNLRSVLDLDVSGWFTALDDGSFGEAVDRWVGPSASISLQYEKPFGNNVLRGVLVQREAEARLRALDEQDLRRRIQLDVLQSASTMSESINRVQQAQLAAQYASAAIEAEMARLRSADATLLDTIVTQQQQVGAALDLVSARLDLARRIARLRFETGQLVTGDTVATQELVTVPGSPQ